MNKLNLNKNIVSFNKNELYKIMEIYSKKIAIGEWKDYSICFKKNYALFCIHKSFSIEPEFRILKNRSLDTNFTLSNRSKIIIKSKSLNKLLNFLKKPNLKLVK